MIGAGVQLTPALRDTLIMVADIAADATEPWWIIGSSAVALHGARVAEVRDVDLMMGEGDARRALERVGTPSTPCTDDPRFRSAVFGIWREPPLPVEVFGDFRITTKAGWRPVRLETCEPKVIAGRTLFVPSVDELHALLLAFGRSKDLERARLLRP